MIMNHKILYSAGILLISNLGVLFLVKNTTTLIVLLLLIGIIKHKYFPIKKELVWYVLILVGGSLIEFVLVNFGSAWSYSNSQLFGIPAWIPFYWGLMGTTLIVLYDGLTSYKS